MANTLVSDNANGIVIAPFGSGTTNGVLDHVQIQNNASDGLHVITPSQVNVTVSDSLSTDNGSSGISAISQGGTPVNVMVRNSTIANNGTNGLLAVLDSGATIFVTRSTITGNGTGWNGSVTSYGDNNIDGNTSANTEPPSLLVYH